MPVVCSPSLRNKSSTEVEIRILTSQGLILLESFLFYLLKQKPETRHLIIPCSCDCCMLLAAIGSDLED
jgi:hypothetical protein